MPSNPSNKVKSESIDEVIIRLLGLTVGAELDEQTYFEILRKKLFNSRVGGKRLTDEEDKLLRNEIKAVKRRIDSTGGKRFKVKKGKTKVSANSSSKGPGNQRALPPSGSLVKTQKNKISNDRVQFVVVQDITEKSKKVSKKSEGGNFDSIRKTLDSINEILKSKFKFDKKQSEKERIEKESEKREKRESSLEGFKKGISGIVSATKKMLSPFQNIIDRVLRFVFFTLLGRAFTKFMEWMDDKENQEKFNSFIEFLSSHWPALAGLYILFGTSFGKLVRGLLKGATRMTIALIANIGKIRKFITKNKKLAFLGAAITPLATRELGNIFGEDKETPESQLIPKDGTDLSDAKKSVDEIKNTEVPKLNLGGIVPKFNLGGMIPSFVRGGINPFGMGMDFSSGIPISGAGQDDTLIAAKTGEAILTEGDQKDIGQRYVDRTTGQPLNIPQYLSGRKPGSVSMGNLRFPGMGGAFFNGGVVSKFNNGGIVGGNAKIQNPKISPADYHSLLAISALEDTDPQGRADVAQSLYNRMFASKKYGLNFNQRSNSLKDLITAGGGRDSGGQYEPTFSNKSDWLNIKDKMSAAIAVMNSEKGRRYKWDIKEAMRQLDATEKALKNPILQSSAQKHVGGRTFFLGTSQQDNMKPGDVLRNPKQNFFSPWYTEGTPYDKERRNIASPIPEMLLPKNNKSKPKQQTLIDKFLIKIKGGVQSLLNFGNNSNSKPQKKADGGVVTTRTGIDVRGSQLGSDTQITALKPREGVLTVPAMQKLFGGSEEKFNTFIAALDPSSKGAKMGYRSNTTPSIQPYSKNVMSGTITLPPITSGTSRLSPRASGLAGGSEVPSFTARHPNGMHYKYAEQYGLMVG